MSRSPSIGISFSDVDQRWVRARPRTVTEAVAELSEESGRSPATCRRVLWCLVASERRVCTRTLIRYYAKRWGIETSFRDIKDLRFGMGMSSMQISRPDRRDRLLLLSALSMRPAENHQYNQITNRLAVRSDPRVGGSIPLLATIPINGLLPAAAIETEHDTSLTAVRRGHGGW